MKNLSLLFFFFIFATNPAFSQNTIHIPGDYPTIQEGINAASNGDIVLVDEGTYYENIIYFGKNITVASHFLIDGDESHIENTIINGSQPSNPDSGSVVMIVSGEDSTATLFGFTITGGTGIKLGIFKYGGGIYIRNASPTISNNIIEFNELTGDLWIWGTAINAGVPYDYSTLTIENNIIRNNFGQTRSNSYQVLGTVLLDLQSSGVAIVRNNSIYNNILTGEFDVFGGGLCILGHNSSNYICYIENNKIYDNELTDTPGSSTQWGGGIYLQDILAYVRNNIIAFNSAEDGGGLYHFNWVNPPTVTPILENNTIFGNTATGYGGALNTNRPYEIVNCIIWDNSSPQYYQNSATISYSDIEEPYPNGSNNISENPEFLDTLYFLLSDTSPCIDAGNPAPMYFDVEDPNNLGYALYPAMGMLRNDMGTFGGPNSTWASVLSDTLHVPANYATIQEAIDAAIDGNVVLVADGTYLENINFSGKAITVASHFLTDGDSTHIENTIIDGSDPSHPDSGSVIVFNSGEDTTSILCGFTITGGTGTYDPFPVRIGGGILCLMSGAKIINCHIENNTIEYQMGIVNGGGISVGPPGNTSWVILENNIISNNSILGAGGSGGGIGVIGNVKLLNNIIEYNTAESIGESIWGGGIALSTNNIPSNYERFVIGNIIRHNKAIAPTGTGNDGGVGGGLAISGESNATIKNNVITYNEVQSNVPVNNCFGGGVILQNQTSNTIFSNNIVAFNKALSNSECKGAGIVLWGADFSPNPILYNNIIVNNTNGTYGGGLYIGGWGGVNTSTIINNTIYQNSATYGGAVYSDQAQPLIINSILWNNGSEIFSTGGEVKVYYSDIQGGFTGEGNIDANPLFVDPTNGDFQLQNQISPCLQKGVDSIDIGGTMYYCPPLCINGVPRPSPAGTLPDIGACENQNPVGVKDNLSQIPEEYSLAQNYPNPFNPTTTIVYGLRERTNVELKLFDVLGSEIEIFVSGEQDAGYYEIEFDATILSSGIYFYRIQAGSFVETKKMVLMK